MVRSVRLFLFSALGVATRAEEVVSGKDTTEGESATAEGSPVEVESSSSNSTSTDVKDSNATVLESVSANLTFAFVQEAYDGLTFAARVTGGPVRGIKPRAFRLGNIELIGDDYERQKKALSKKLPSGIILIREAPEEVQYFPAAERNATFYRILQREKDALKLKIQADLQNTEHVPEPIDPEIDEKGQWRNVTIVDAWSYDGTHLAQSLAYSYPTLFNFIASPYPMDEDIERARTYDDEAEPGTVNPNYHILSVANGFKRQKSLKKIAEVMREAAGKDKGAAAAAKLLGVDIDEDGEMKPQKKPALTEEEESMNQAIGLSVLVALILGACVNFGRGPLGKGKAKPSKKFIEKELNSIEYTRSAKATNKKSKYGPKPVYEKKTEEELAEQENASDNVGEGEKQAGTDASVKDQTLVASATDISSEKKGSAVKVSGKAKKMGGA